MIIGHNDWSLEPELPELIEARDVIPGLFVCSTRPAKNGGTVLTPAYNPSIQKKTLTMFINGMWRP